jgi:uncharacterized membrane protein YfcA
VLARLQRSASVTKTGGSVVHGLNKAIDWRIVRRLAVGSLPASLATMAVQWLLKIDQASYSALVTKILGVAVIMQLGFCAQRSGTGRYPLKPRAMPVTGTVRSWSGTQGEI